MRRCRESAVLAIPATANATADGYGNNGSEQAWSVGAQCGAGAGSGAFGALGNFGYRHDLGQGDTIGSAKLGANGPATGAGNSAICGNSQ